MGPMVLRVIRGLSLALILQVSATGFNHFWWDFDQNQNADNAIMHFSTVLEVPFAESSDLVLWPGFDTNPKGIGVEADRLVQSLVHNDAWGKNEYCGEDSQDPNTYCANAYVFCNDQGPDPGQGWNLGQVVHPGDLVHIAYDYNPASQNTTQTLTILGSHLAIPPLSWKTGPGYHISTAAECTNSDGATINTPQHTYYNTTFVLDHADLTVPNYISSIGGRFDPFLSPDGGITWVASNITIFADTCTGN